MSFGRSSVRLFAAMLAALLLAGILPALVGAASAGPQRSNYIVTLDVAGSGASIRPSSKANRKRIRQRAVRADRTTDRVAATHEIRPRHRFTRSMTGFSARMTAAEAADLARDAEVANVRPARRFKPAAAQFVPRGIKRVKAAPNGSPGPDVNADVAILDTGIGPVFAGELNVAGGINCAKDPGSVGFDPDDWQESNSLQHGTHVAGTVGARDNGVGVVGVAPGARLWAVRVFDGSYGDEVTIVCGLEWAIATHDPDDAPPGSQPIEVVNMSIQGPRGSMLEGCPSVDEDPIHQAICTAVEDYGITVVAAAGNAAGKANRSSPGGYNQVITVGALSDFDGVGGGDSSSNCAGYKNDLDDGYASYSNYGADIDILAPGTCVVSTGTGDDLRTLTGTSMATPHVAGAVARYLAANPGTTPEQMRKIVRAAGRMDWRAKTDPVWSGVRDQDEPNRVLDVAALMGGHSLKVWLYHDGFKLKDGAHDRSTRVDVQRGGGYSGTVSLAVSGMPGSVGSSSLQQSTLNGLSGLGTRLNLDVKKKASEGAHDVQVEADGSGVPSHTRSLELVIDRTGPDVTGLHARIKGGRVALPASGAATAFIEWEADDALTNVKNATLRRKAGSQQWRTVGKTEASSYKVSLKPGQNTKFKVGATDSLGNTSWSGAIEVRLSVRDSSSAQWSQPAAGGWKTKAAKKAHGGSVLVAKQPADSLVTSFEGRAFAIVAPVGPSRGDLRVIVDGGEPKVVDLTASKGQQRRVVFSRRVEAGPHTVEIEGFSGQTAVDAILILR